MVVKDYGLENVNSLSSLKIPFPTVTTELKELCENIGHSFEDHDTALDAIWTFLKDSKDSVEVQPKQ